LFVLNGRGGIRTHGTL